MTKPNFTPGPWSIQAEGINIGNGHFVPFGCGCCSSLPWMSGDTPDQEESNAHLIAAAPELYELAAKVASLNKDAGTIGLGMLNTLVDMAEMVTKKARGEG